MCGIFVTVSKGTSYGPSLQLKERLQRRGPDHCGIVRVSAKSAADGDVSLLFNSTVLSLRGGHVVEQPLVADSTGSILCWNGEAWKVDQNLVQGNDSAYVLDLLTVASSDASRPNSLKAVIEVFQRISGPFAFVYFDKLHNLLYYGRDRLGRRSLSYAIAESLDSISFASVSESMDGSWGEVEADGLYVLALERPLMQSAIEPLNPQPVHMAPFAIYRFPWPVHDVHNHKLQNFSLGRLNPTLPQEPLSIESASGFVQQLEDYLAESLKLRILNIPDPPNDSTKDRAKLAILFSGGLDCTVLARIAHEILPSDEEVDLLNVAFENPRVVQAARKSQKPQKEHGHDNYAPYGDNDESNDTSIYESCPDRITGRNSLKELRNICSTRKWNFVAINIPYKETVSHKHSVVSLIHPQNTEMDLSIAYALYFAARGTGLSSNDYDIESHIHTTSARVLLSGLGADELFGGYTRHATAFSREGYPGLINELQLDIDRLGKRNLGRDDRVISDWGREARYPYLDEDLVAWAISCPVWQKCGFGLIPESQDDHLGISSLEPGKRILRLLAWKLGMHNVAKEKKRAVQFGARTAKMETGRTKGTSVISI